MSSFLRPGALRRQFARPHVLHSGAIGTSRAFLIVAFAVALAAVAGCAHRRNTTANPPAPVPQPSNPSQPSGAPPPISGEYVEQGIASWYGVPFNGRRTSNGEIYDMHQFTAAHRTLPFGSMVRVTNLQNGKQTEVRINDRGPFVANRVIDLSQSAAQALGMIGTGTARVKLEVVAAGVNPSGGFFAVQVGAFLKQENAEKLKENLASRYAPIDVVAFDSPSGIFYRVRVGRLPTENAAQRLAGQLRNTEQFTTFVIRIDN